MMVLESITEAFVRLSEYFYVIAAAVVAASLLCIVAETCFYSRRKVTRQMKRTNRYVKGRETSREETEPEGMFLPEAFESAWKDYRASAGRMPSEFFRLPKTIRPKVTNYLFPLFALFTGLMAALYFMSRGFSAQAAVCVSAVPAMEILLKGLQNIVYRLRDIRSEKVFAVFCKNINRVFGQSYLDTEKEPDLCLNRDVDEAVEKIEILKRGGIGEDTAKKVAEILNEKSLNKPRTVEQQKKINLALNGLLQTLSKKDAKELPVS